MSIDRSGEYWTGTGAGDLDEYLRELTADGYPADRIVHARCGCGHDRFELLVDANEGCAQRACSSCGRKHFICDSEEYWSDADPEETACPCGGTAFEIAVGFSHRADASVKWITVGQRCTKCGVLGAAVDWKVDYGPTEQLYDQV
ncbi:MAG: hypothetical protein IPQ07_35880 [Myxococcales bacterium]|nr:hypothetical protein [Myxococcales bacterium]